MSEPLTPPPTWFKQLEAREGPEIATLIAAVYLQQLQPRPGTEEEITEALRKLDEDEGTIRSQLLKWATAGMEFIAPDDYTEDYLS